eukprot:TRINITY_DN12863_c0_g2_i3.p1 TRINITY_DN12863_c0_g2~~TRINITY_DN12863_c0_g2_i3.p1  ORF type:complete len:560 (+),score=17.19 TRINITY_DN12863_c0_g2_i3:69-1682(+)
MKKNRSPPHTNGCSSGIPHFDIAAPGFDNLQWSTANVCGERPGTGFRNKQQSEALGKWYNSCGSTADCLHLCDKLEPAFRKGCKLFASWGWRRGDPEGVKFRAVECPAAFVRHVGGLFDRNGVTAAGSSPNNPNPTPASTPIVGGGCCKFGADCGDCGDDLTGWCHKSSANCDVCTGVYDPSAPAPQCGGSAPSPTPARPSPVPRPTPSTATGGGCCKFGGDCGDCGDDLTGWCHKSSANCDVCTGDFDPSAQAPQCGGSAPSPTPARPSPVPRPTPPTATGGGCCKFGGDCGDCGDDLTGWCHESSENCVCCEGIFDPSAPAPQCGGSAASPTPARPSPIPRPTPPTDWGTSVTPAPSPIPRPTPPTDWGTSPTPTWPSPIPPPSPPTGLGTSPTPTWSSPVPRPTPPTGWGTSPTPTWPSPVPRPTPPTDWGTSVTPAPSPIPRPTPPTDWGTSPTPTWPSPIPPPSPPTGLGTSPTPTWSSPVPRPTPPTGWGTSPTPTWPSPSPRPSPSSGWGTSPTSTWPWLCAFTMSLMST